MASSTLSPLHRQINRASQRLFLQTLVNYLAKFWAGALVLAIVWLLVEPFVCAYLLKAGPSAELRWAVAGGIAGLATALAVALAFVQSPPRLTAALALDERFGLRERVTTSLLLRPDQYDEPAAQALLLDVEERVAQLDVGSRFPIRFAWSALGVPVLAGILGLVAVFYEVHIPREEQPGQGDNTAQGPANLAAIENQVEKLKKEEDRDKRPVAPDSDQVRKWEDELDNLAKKSFKSEDDLRERFGEMDQKLAEGEQLRDKLEKKQQAQKDQLDRLSKKPKDGPAKDLQDALAKGDFDKAKEEADRLMKKLQDEGKDKLDPEEQDKLREQLDDLKNDLDRLSRQQDEQDKLEAKFKEGEIDEETLDREMDRIKEENKDLKELEELSEDLAECQKCLEEGDCEGAAKALRRASAKMKKMGGQQGELERLSRKLDELQNAKQKVADGMSKKGGGPPGGRRPEDKDGQTGSYKTRVESEPDKKGQRIITGQGPPGKSFKPKSTEEMVNEIRQTRQGESDPLAHQRLPAGFKDAAKGYYENAADLPKKDKKP